MILGYNIFNSSLESIDLVNNKIINTINPHSYCVANKDLDFKEALKNSDILLPDGIGIVWAEKFLNGNSIKKIAGYDLFLFLMNKLNNEYGSVFFLGASENTLEKIKSKSSQEYPNITFGNYSPPYKLAFSEKDSKIMCDEVNFFNPDVLFVGMTAPKQEKWVHLYKNKLNANIICSIGAVFDFYAGNVKRSSDIWISLGLEWLPRLIKEPRRLFYRNFVSTPKFILYVLSIKIFGQDNSK
ncbi:WecB/TagA/CpsF family glycosyltransferase [Polaribacter sp.]|nr:WecB/TagA/CpsF family glycosyltransferase [Polaribacter sp.]